MADPVLIGASTLFRQVLSVVDTVAANDCIVLLEGESGTGKELLARRIHLKSHRIGNPFIPVNCPAISESLFESQFYGHLRGSFTGAAGDTLGSVRAAEGGTLLLDEVGELDIRLQPKLLRLLQEREVTPVGANEPIPVNVRFVAATNRSLVKSISEGTFRSDLYHRLNVVRIEIPPLRSRPEDITPLVEYFLELHSRRYAMPIRCLSESLMRSIREYPWPGNIRELSTYIERMYATNLPPTPPATYHWNDGYQGTYMAVQPPADRMPAVDNTPVCCSLRQAELQAIRQALDNTGYNRSAAARILEIHRTTLLRKMREFGL